MSREASAKAASPASPAGARKIAVRKLCARASSRLSSVSVPGRDEAHHVAPHHGLRPALPRLGRVLDLLAHRDAMALRDQALEIFVGGMHRHAAHGDVLAEMLAALGERDAKRAAGDGGVLEEQLVEIAHAVEQEAIGIGRFDLQILGHHRRGDARGARGPHLVRARDVSRRKIPPVRREPRSLPRPWLGW